MHERRYDVVVVGAGAAGVAAALAARKNGKRVLLIDAGPAVGGELVSGLPIDGCLNASGEWIVGGVARRLFDSAREIGGFVLPLFDWRLIWAVCVDPVTLSLAIVQTLAREKVDLLLYTLITDVVSDSGTVTGVVATNKNGQTLITADFFIDCTGDGDVAVAAGAPFELGGPNNTFQPVTLVFRMANIDYGKYLAFVRDNPDEYILGDSPVIGDRSKAECAKEIYDSGYPFAGLSASASVLGTAIESGRMYPCTAVYVWPTAPDRRELGLNTTRIANVDATDTEALSGTLSALSEQVGQCVRFVRDSLPGFEEAALSAIAPRVGIRETRRIMGEHVLDADEVVEGRKSEHGIAKGGHHIDVHGAGKDQVRVPVKDGKSYDIPYGCMIPRRVKNVYVTGRALSSTREAHGSATVMGQCMATGEAAATAASICIENGNADARSIDIQDLRSRLKEHGVVIDGTA